MQNQQPREPNGGSGDQKKIDDAARLSRNPPPNRDMKHDDFISFIKHNTKDVIAYVLAVVGVIMMFFDPTYVYGGLLVGIIIGLYFAKEIAYAFVNFNELVEKLGHPKSILLGLILLLFLIQLPFVVIGIALVGGLKAFFASNDNF